MTVSQAAARTGTPNIPDSQKVQNLKRLCLELLEPIREIVGSPITITSGYRSPQVNGMVGGSLSSAHLKGFAADINAHSFGSSRKLATLLVEQFKERGIAFDQLILEFDQWVHVGLIGPAGQQRGQVLTAKKFGGKTHYLAGLQ
jgi:hypothetical protein